MQSKNISSVVHPVESAVRTMKDIYRCLRDPRLREADENTAQRSAGTEGASSCRRRMPFNISHVLGVRVLPHELLCRCISSRLLPVHRVMTLSRIGGIEPNIEPFSLAPVRSSLVTLAVFRNDAIAERGLAERHRGRYVAA